MKKIFLLIISVICFYGFTNNTYLFASDYDSTKEIEKPLYVVQGSDINDLIEYEGYQISSNNVNIYTPGKYIIEYKKDEMTYKKNVIVVQKEDLVKGLDNVKLVKSYDIETLFLYDQIEDYEVLSYRENDKTYLEINGHKITLFDGVYGQVKSVLFHNNEFYIGGELFSNDSLNDIFIYKLSKDYRIIYKQVLSGAFYERFSDFGFLNDKLIVCGDTNSSDELFKSSYTGVNSFVLSIDPSNGGVLDYVDLGTPSNDEITHVTFGSNITLCRSSYQFNTQTFSIINIDETFNINILQTSFLDIRTIYDQKIINDKIYILFGVYDRALNRTISKLLLIDNDEIRVIDSFEDPYYTAQSLMVENDHVSILYVKYNRNDKEISGYLVRKFDDDGMICQSKIDSSERIHTAKFVSQTKFYLKYNEKIDIFEQTVIKLKDESSNIISKHDEKHYTTFFINDTTISSTIDNLETDVYGIKKVCSVFKTSKLDLVYSIDINILLISNIKEGEVFDLNTKVYFNGVGYLNNELIENEYELTKEGNYVLKVKGNSDTYSYISFSVKSNSSDIKEKITVSPYVSNIQISKEIIEDTKLESVSTSLTSANDVEKNNIAFILIPFICTALFIVILIGVKKYEKNHC